MTPPLNDFNQIRQWYKQARDAPLRMSSIQRAAETWQSEQENFTFVEKEELEEDENDQ